MRQYQHFLWRCEAAAEEPPLWWTAAEIENNAMASSETLLLTPARPLSSRPPSPTTAPPLPLPTAPTPKQIGMIELGLILMLCGALLLYIAAVFCGRQAKRDGQPGHQLFLFQHRSLTKMLASRAACSTQDEFGACASHEKPVATSKLPCRCPPPQHARINSVEL